MHDHRDDLSISLIGDDKRRAISIDDDFLEPETERRIWSLYGLDARQRYVAGGRDGMPPQGSTVHNANLVGDTKQPPVKIPSVGRNPKKDERCRRSSSAFYEIHKHGDAGDSEGDEDREGQ